MACCLSSPSRSFGFFRRGGANSSSKACCAVEARLERVLRRLVEQSGSDFLAADAKNALAYCKTLALQASR